MKKALLFLIIIIFFLIGLIALQLEISNPYSHFTTVSSPFITKTNASGEISLVKQRNLYVSTNPILYYFAFIQSGFREFAFALDSEKPFPGNENQIIQQIHAERFDPSKPYVISGAHFTDLYIRNLGVFYSTILDNCLATSKQDWENRQRSALQTLAIDLLLLKQVKQEPSTFMPLGNNLFIPVNIYARPSDSLYAILYTFSVLKNEHTFEQRYREPRTCYAFQSEKASDELFIDNKQLLKNLLDNYQSSILDPGTGLVKKDINLASARDGVKRQSSFYDNVIAWSTVKLAGDLGIENESSKNLSLWRQKIIDAFWDEKEGIFLDDLSQTSKVNKTFSGDSFIVLQTQFLDPSNREDKRKLEKMIQYVKQNKLDQPMPLRYAKNDNLEILYPAVRTFAPSYMGESIWSHWGMEYIKTLISLSPDNPRYLSMAQDGLDIYKKMVQTYGGYPELYDRNGKIFSTGFYKSVLHTGWVVNYEETRQLLQDTQDKNLNK